LSGSAAASDADWKPKANPWLIAVVVTMAAFMEILDTTIVNVSLPHIAGSVSASYDDATWTLTSYLVANGIVLPISGFLGRLIGRKRYFLICIAMFTVCSFLCGTSTSLGELVVFRLFQGFFGGGLQPNQQSIILDTFPPAKRSQAFSVVAVAVIFAPAIGPTLGGWITDNYSWRWIFFINIPVGMLAFFAVATLVEDPPWVLRMKAKIADTDWTGLALIAVGFGCLQVMMDRGEDDDWFSSGFIRAMAFLGAVFISGAVVWLCTTKKPIVNLLVFLDRNFAVGSIMIFGLGAVLYMGTALIPQLAQQHLGYTALLAGLVLSPSALVLVILVPLVGKVLLQYVQPRYVVGFGFLLIGLAFAYSHTLTPDISYGRLVFLRILQMLGLAFLFVPNSTISYATLPRELNGDGSALYVMVRNVAGSIGISGATALVTQRTQVHQAYLSEQLSPLNSNYNALVAQTTATLQTMGHSAAAAHSAAMGMINKTLVSQSGILAYTDVFAYAAIAAFCVAPLALLFKSTPGKPAGDAPPQH
jgi:DHA2 family multidrug resistance protein